MQNLCKTILPIVLATLFPVATRVQQIPQNALIQNQSKPSTKVKVPGPPGEQPHTLGSIKRKYLNQTVVIKISQSLDEWYPVVAEGPAVSGCKLAPPECRTWFAAELGFMINRMRPDPSGSQLGELDIKAIFAMLQQLFPNGGRWGVFVEGGANDIFAIASPDTFRSEANQISARSTLLSNASLSATLCKMGFRFVRLVPFADIVNNGTEYDLRCPDVARNPGNVERYGREPHSVASSYAGKSGVVVAIQLHEAVSRKTNAFGEVIEADDITLADLDQVDFVVKLGDGKMVIASAFRDNISDFLQVASEHDAAAHEITASLPSIIGKRVYAVGYSQLYPPDATMEEIQGTAGVLKQIPMTDIPLLEPLEITAANYIESSNAVVLKLKAANGSELLAITDSSLLSAATDGNESFLKRVSGSLLPGIPKALTPQEILAIKKRRVFRGMSKDAVDFALGFPDGTNDWGNGGKQLIYFSNSLFIYLDNRNKVTDIQSLQN
jgi:hypothetical protein